MKFVRFFEIFVPPRTVVTLCHTFADPPSHKIRQTMSYHPPIYFSHNLRFFRQNLLCAFAKIAPNICAQNLV